MASSVVKRSPSSVRRFTEAYLDRVNERSLAVDTAAFRAETDEIYHQICLNLNYFANVESTETMMKVHAANSKRSVGDINQLIKEFKVKIGGLSTEGTSQEGLSPDPSLESEGSEMLNDDSQVTGNN